MTTVVIAFDLDGTLVRTDKTIHPRDIEILRSFSGPLLIPVTARSLYSVKKLFGYNGLFEDSTIPFPLVCQNGSSLFGLNETLLHQECFSSDTTERLVDTMRSHPSVSSWLHTPYDVYTIFGDEFSEAIAAEFDFDLQPYNHESGRNFVKANAFASDLSSIDAFSESVSRLDLNTSYYRPTVLEIYPPGVNKGRGLLNVLTCLNTRDAKIFAAGDTLHDMTLFDVAEYSYAPLTAEKIVRHAATRVFDLEMNGLFESVLSDLDCFG